MSEVISGTRFTGLRGARFVWINMADAARLRPRYAYWITNILPDLLEDVVTVEEDDLWEVGPRSWVLDDLLNPRIWEGQGWFIKASEWHPPEPELEGEGDYGL